MLTLKNLLLITGYPAALEMVRFSILLFLGEAATESGLLMKFSEGITLFLFGWIGWRTWRLVKGDLKLAFVVSLAFSTFLMLLQFLSLILDMGQKDLIAAISDVVLGFIISFIFFFLPLSFFFTLLGWRFSKVVKQEHKSKGPPISRP